MAETLELKIKTTADQTAKSIGNLESKLRSLGSALSSISNTNVSNFSNSLNSLATSIRGLGNIDTRTFSKVAQNVQKLGSIDSSKLVGSASALNEMSKELSAFSGLAKQSQNITALIQSISKLGSKSSSNAATNIRQLGSALKDVMTTLSSAPKVSQNIIQMTNALANLANQGSKVGSASRSLTASFSNVTKSTGKTKSGFGGLSAAIGKFYATYWLLIRASSKLRDAVDLSSQLTEVQNVVDTTFGNMTNKVDEFTQTSIQDFGMSELAAKQISSRFQAMGTAVGITSQQVANGTALINERIKGTEGTLYKTSDSMADMSLNLTRLAADMASFYDVDQADVAKSLQSVFTGTTAPLRRYGLDLTQATLKEWALKNGLDGDIKSMSQAEKVLLRYQYVMANTTAAQGDFAKTANTWANSVRVLKQEFQAWGSIIGGVIINAFKPLVVAMNKVMLKVISFTKTIADALGAIFGWTIDISGSGIADDMEDVADSTGDIGTSADKSNKKAQKLKRTLLSIDEIHALDDNSDSSGSGSGGSGSGGGAGGGADSTLKKTDGLIEKYKSSIKDLYELGSYIGDALSSAMESIDWDKIYHKADNFGKGLADFLNGLISPRLFYDLGKTIAGSLNTALHFLNSFGTNFDWSNFGNSIAAGINGFFENYDFGMLGRTITAWAHGILTALTKAVEKVDWAQIGQSIAEFFSEIDIVETAIDLSKLVTAIGKALVTAFANWFANDPLSATIVTGIGLAKLTGLGDAMSKMWNGSWTSGDAETFRGTVQSKLNKLKFQVGVSLVIMGFGEESEAGSGSWANDIAGTILNGIGIALMTNPMTGLVAAIGTLAANIGLRIGNALAGTKYKWKDVLGELASTSFWKDLGHYLYQDYIEPAMEEWEDEIKPKITNVFAKMWNPIAKTLNKVLGTDLPIIEEKAVRNHKGAGKSIAETNDDITKSTKNMGDKVASSLNNVGKKSNDFDSVSRTTAKNVASSYNGLKNNVSTSLLGVNGSIGGTQSKMNALNSTASSSTSSAKGSFSLLSSGISSTLSAANTAMGGTQSKMSGLQSSAQTMSSNASGSFTSLANNASAKLGLTGGSFATLKGKVDSTNSSFGTFKWYTGQSYSVGLNTWGFDSAKSSINNVKTALDNLFTYNNKKLNITTGTKSMGYTSLLDKAPKKFATGGFPKGEDGMFYANHNELVGKFSNGKTAVANNEQITEGIKRAVVEGMTQVAMATSGRSSNSAPIIENTFKVDSETLYRITQKGKAKHNQRYNVVTEF